jgi:hypothetical protein
VFPDIILAEHNSIMPEGFPPPPKPVSTMLCWAFTIGSLLGTTPPWIEKDTAKTNTKGVNIDSPIEWLGEFKCLFSKYG